MSEIPDLAATLLYPLNPHDPCAQARSQPQRHQGGAAQAHALREQLGMAAQQAAQGRLALHVAPAQLALVDGAPGHFHLSTELFVQTAGYTDFQFPAGRLRLLPGQALLVPARVQHHEQVGAAGPAPEQAFGNLVLSAEAQRCSCHLAHEVAPGQPGIWHLEGGVLPQAGAWQAWLAEAAHLGAQGGDWAPLQAQALVCATLAGVRQWLDECQRQPAPPLPPLLARAQTLMNNQLGDAELSVQALAAQCGCTADHLSALFSRHTGTSLMGLLTRQRMARAARLLQDTTLPVKTVAWACGYRHPSHFIQTFRQHHGQTPQAWRQQGGR